MYTDMKTVQAEREQEEPDFEGEYLDPIASGSVTSDTIAPGSVTAIDDTLNLLWKKYGEGGYRQKPLSDTELLTLVVAEQRAEISRLRENFETWARRRLHHAQFWFAAQVGVIILMVLVFALFFHR